MKLDTHNLIRNLLPVLCALGVIRILYAGEIQNPKPSASEARDWPNWRGPYGNGTGIDCGEPLADDLGQAKLLWKSEQAIPESLRGAGGRGHAREDTGFCDPIIHQGRVFMQYFTATGPMDERFLRMINRASPDDSKKEKEGASKPLADDVVLAMDALTGKTLWKTVFPGKGANLNNMDYPSGCYGPHMVICADKGRIVSFSGHGRIYCLRATDGKLLWESNIGPFADHYIMHLEDYSRNHEWASASYRTGLPFFDLTSDSTSSLGTSGIIIDDVLVIPDHWSVSKADRSNVGVRGIDMATGRHLWSVPKCSAKSQAFPTPWRHNGKGYVISSCPSRTVCIDPRNGKVLWEIPASEQACSPTVSGDYLLTQGATDFRAGRELGSRSEPTCYRLTLEKAEKVWVAPDTVRFPTFVGPVVYQNRVYWSGKCMDLKTGKVLKTGGAGLEGYAHIGVDGRVIGGRKIINADPATWGATEGVKEKSNVPELSYCCSSTYANGRLYYRTTSNVVCFDLRKTPSTAKTSIVAIPTVAPDAPVTELVRLVCGDNWPAQEAAAKILRAKAAAAKASAPELVSGVAKAIAAGDQATAGLLVSVTAAVAPSSIETVVAASAKALESKDTLVLVAACAALREAGPKAKPAAPSLARTLATGDDRVTAAAADALAAVGKEAAAAVNTLLTILAGKDGFKVLHASRALMGIGIGAREATDKLVDAYCAHPGPARFYLSETLRAIGLTTIPVLVQKSSAFLSGGPVAKGQKSKVDPELLRDAAKTLKDFGTVAKDTTPFLEKVLASAPQYKKYTEEAINIVNGRPTTRVEGMGKHGYPVSLGPVDTVPPKKSPRNTEPDDK